MSDDVLMVDASPLLIAALKDYPAEPTLVLNVPKTILMRDGRKVSVDVGRVIVAVEES